MKKVFKGFISMLLVVIMISSALPMQTIADFDYKSAFGTVAKAIKDTFNPGFVLDSMEVVAINYGGQKIEEPSLSTKNLRLGIGDSEVIFVNVKDENGNPVENFDGLSWWASPSSAVKLEVDSDTRYCTVTILETEESSVTVYASAYGQTLSVTIEIIGNGVKFASDEYYILVDSTELVLSFDMMLLSSARATWKVSDKNYKISSSDYSFTSSDPSVLSVTGKSHSVGSVGMDGVSYPLYPKVKALKEGTVTLTVTAGNDVDTCTIQVVPLKEYKIEAYSDDLESPLAEAEITADVYTTSSLQTKGSNTSGKTGDDGIITLKLPDVTRCPAFEIAGFADFHPENTIESTSLNSNEINRLPLKCSVTVPGVSAGGKKVETLETDFGDHMVKLLSVEVGFEIPNCFDIVFEVDPGEKKLKGTIDFALDETKCEFNKDDTDVTSATRKESYKQYKTLFDGLKESDKECYNDWRNLRKHSTQKKANIGIEADLSLMGFLELDFSSGKLKFSEGGIVLSAEASYEEEIYTTVPAVFIAFKINGGADGKIVIEQVASGGEAGKLALVCEFSFTLGADIGAGVGCDLAKLSLMVGGDFNVEVKLSTKEKLTLSDILKVTVELSGYLELKIDIWIFKFKGQLDLAKATGELYPNLSFDFEWIGSKGADESSFELMPRDYLYNDVLETQSLTAEMHLNNVYPSGNPQVETLANGNKVAVWLADNGNKSSVNRTTLMYSLFNGSTWSEPKAVYESGKLDGTPELYADGNKAYVLWLRGEEVFDDDIAFEEYITKTELVFSTFDGSKWSTPTRVDNDNNKYQLYYSIAAENGNVTVSWTENSENDVYLSSGTTKIYQKNLTSGVWGTQTQVVSTTKPVNTIASGYIGGQPKVAYSLDEDGLYDTKGDNAVYVGNTRVAYKTGIDYLGLNYCDGKFYFAGNNKLCVYDGSLTSTEKALDTGYMLVSNGDEYALIYQKTSNFRNELYVSYSNDGITFTEPIQLTSYENLIKTYDCVMNDDGSITVCSNLTYVDYDTKFGHTDFIIETFSDKTELELVDAAYNMSLTYEQRDIIFEATVRNQGTKPLNGFRLSLVDSKGRTVYYKDFNDQLGVGETAVETITYVLPADYKGDSLTLKISNNKDTDLSNNEHEFIFKYADISVTGCEITDDGYITAIVKNEGYLLAEDVSVKLYKFSEEYDEFGSVIVGDLAVGESKTISYKIPAGMISFDSYLTHNSFKVEAVTPSGEFNYSNNEDFALVSPTRVTNMNLVDSSIVLATGDTMSLAVQFSPVNATDKTVYWFTNNEKVVKVDENGVITAVGLGTATITAISSDGRIEDTCQVTVAKTVPVTGIEVVPNTVSVLVSSTKQLTANVLPSNATNKAVSWSTSNASVATVSNSGLVTAKAKGTVTITAKTSDGGYQARCTVTVVSSSVAVTGITLNQSAMTLYVGDVGKLAATISPNNATNTNVVWSSSNTSVAQVDQNGTVTAIKNGTATIKATTADGGFSAQCTVTVKEKTVAVQGIEISKETMQMVIGDTGKLNATVLPLDSTNKNVIWKSSDNSVATVDANGNVAAVGQGKATISVKTVDGGFVAQCTITVSAPIGHGKIVSVKLNSAPNVTSYQYKQSGGWNLSGLTLLVTYSDGTTEIITDTSKMEISNFDTGSTGKKDVEVKYEGYTVSFQVEVKYAWWQWIIVIVLFGWIWY